MSTQSHSLAEPLTLGRDTVTSRNVSIVKVVLASFLLGGLVCAIFFSPVAFAHSAIEEPAIDMLSLSCPRFNMPMSIRPMQEALTKNGMKDAYSPLATFALTQFAASRDVTMAAQANEAFAELDPVTKAKVEKLGRDVVVRAEVLRAGDPDWAKETAGATLPVGFFDPWGLSKNTKIAFLRSSELKHGRVCMLASLGFVVSEKFHPIFDGWGEGEFKSAVGSHFTPTAQENFWPAFLVLAGAHEYYTEFLRGRGSNEPYLNAGDFGFDPLGIKPKTPEKLMQMQNREINNGRLAMIAAAGMIAQELATGKKIF